ncbi:MAG: c-type cytochrome [Pseudomonadota bacterium]
MHGLVRPLHRVAGMLAAIVAVSVVSAVPLTRAEPASEVAFTAELLGALETTDPEAGRSDAQACVACHGEQGLGTGATFPDLAGQVAPFLYKQLRDFRDGKRSDAVMSPFAQGLDEAALRRLAVYFAARTPRPTAEEPPRPPELARVGDGDRMIPPCASCHGYQGEGRHRLGPALAGQPQQYLEKQLRGFRSGERASDVYGVMRSMAESLTDREIDRLAGYYAKLRR